MNSPRQIEIAVVSHGWHTGFVIPAQALVTQLPALRSRFGDTPYLEIGWGDSGFYQANEITTLLALKALLLPTDSVVHAVALGDSARVAFPRSEVATTCLGAESFSTLLGFLSASFSRDQDGNIQPLSEGLYGDSQFYAGKDRFHALNTCNKWTARGLQSAGIAISPDLKLTASSVMDHLSDTALPCTPMP